MSPVFGVGVNYAVQDAVAAARLLAPPLLGSQSTTPACRLLQRRRQWPVRLMQPLQQSVHTFLSSGNLAALDTMEPWRARAITLGSKLIRPVAARVVGRGFLPESLNK